MPSPAPAYALALNALILGTAVTLVGYWWLTRTGGGEGGSDPVEDWHDEAAGLAREVQRVAEAAEGVVERDRVQRQVVPLSERIKGHARSAPSGVDERLVGACHALGVDCYEVGMEHTTLDATRTGEFLEDELERLGASAAAFEATLPSGSGDEG